MASQSEDGWQGWAGQGRAGQGRAGQDRMAAAKSRTFGKLKKSTVTSSIDTALRMQKPKTLESIAI